MTEDLNHTLPSDHECPIRHSIRKTPSRDLLLAIRQAHDLVILCLGRKKKA